MFNAYAQTQFPSMLPPQLKLLKAFQWLSSSSLGKHSMLRLRTRSMSPWSTSSSRTDLIFYSAWMKPLYNSHFLMPCLSPNLITQWERLTGGPHGHLYATWRPPQRFPWWYWAQDNNSNPRLSHDSFTHDSPLNILHVWEVPMKRNQNNQIRDEASKRQRYKKEVV